MKARNFIEKRVSHQALSSAAHTRGEWQVLNCIKSVCKIYKVPVQDLVNAVQQSSKDMAEVVRPSLSNLFYNTEQILRLVNLEHVRLSLKDLSVLVPTMLQGAGF